MVTPLKLQILSTEGAKWVSWCKHRLAGLTNLRMQTKGSILKQTYALPDNVMAMVISWDVCDIIRIWGGDDGVFIFNNKLYPSYSRLLFDDQWSADYAIGITSYGNTDWKGPNGEVLCWKGVASRHFEIDPMKNVAGYMAVDEEITVGGLPVTVYTPFGSDIYAESEVLASVPSAGATGPKVLGCAYIAGILVAVVGNNYREMSNPAGGFGGFFNEVWVNYNGWKRIGFEQGSRPAANWFFNQSGTEAQCVSQKQIKKISVTSTLKEDGTYDFIVAFATKDACSGNVSEAIANDSPGAYGQDLTYPGIWTDAIPSNFTIKNGDKLGGNKTATTITISETQECVVAVDYVGDVEVIKKAIYTLTEKSESHIDTYGIFSWLPIIPYRDPYPMVIGFGHNIAEVGDTPGVAGGCAPFTWTISRGTCDPSSGQILTLSCGTPGASALITWTVVDNGGQSATLTVPGCGGHWEFIESIVYGSYTGSPCSQVNCSIGGTTGGSTSPYFSGMSTIILISETWCFDEAIGPVQGTVLYSQGTPDGACDFNMVAVQCDSPHYIYGEDIFEWQC